MITYRARLEGFDTGKSGVYDFEDREDLIRRPADELVAAFFAYANRALFESGRLDYELNGVMRHNAKNVVIGMGTMFLDSHPDGLPFTVTINPAAMG